MIILKYISKSVEDTIAFAKELAKYLKSGDVVLLVGDLGTGKTHIAKGIGEAIGVKRIINSPTFTIVKEYMGTNTKLYHLDLYRLNGLNNDYDLEEYFNSDGITLVEWPYQIKEIIPSEYIKIELIKTNDNERIIELSTTDKYKKVEELLCIH